MRKNLQKIATKLRPLIAKDEEHLERLRHDMDHTNAVMEAAQAAADESRKTFDQLRMKPSEWNYGQR
jgi:flagellar biosynthesis regulator FlaF